MPLSLVTWNLKDFFDPRDEEERAHFAARLAHLGPRLRALDPDVIALEEVGSAAVVEALLSAAGLSRHTERVLGSADARGIRNVIASRLPLDRSEVLTAEVLSFPKFHVDDAEPFPGRIPLRRGVPHARVRAPGIGPVDVLACHFKSQRAVSLHGPTGPIEDTTAAGRAAGELRSLVWRSAEALFVRTACDQLLEGRAEGQVVVVGDLNATPDAMPLRVLRGGGAWALTDLTRAVPEAERFSIVHEGRREQIDHALATSELAARVQSVRFENGELRDHSALSEGTRALDSDHAALFVQLR